MKETIEKINKTKSWFFEKINKIDLSVHQQMNGERRKVNARDKKCCNRKAECS